ncbi:hypothetical protein [Aureimonas leprariae]|uniref:Uncharacterized protein n=1 Tax=Plantimonas leprariae TaxID=2615207 RepID=A0A7V7TWT6_9HYPH|nr:hypothetical protein [Aureimonas leprariae]KAB0680160.1 hypothetical protein F6X38_08190 [Aureimonas leprariae]
MSGVATHRVLVAPGEWKTIPFAAVHAKRSEVTIRRWIKQHGISRQSCPGAPHEINMMALEMVRHGDLGALNKLRVGDWEAAEVQRYLLLLGMSFPSQPSLLSG